jgi:hypothetical protein
MTTSDRIIEIQHDHISLGGKLAGGCCAKPARSAISDAHDIGPEQAFFNRPSHDGPAIATFNANLVAFNPDRTSDESIKVLGHLLRGYRAIRTLPFLSVELGAVPAAPVL